MTLKELRAEKRRLESEAQAKLKLITADTSADDQSRIESEHAALLAEIQRVAGEIATREGDEDGDEAARKRKRKARAKKDDDESDDDDDDKSDDDSDEDEDDDKKRKGKKRALKKASDGEDKDDGDEDKRSAGTELSRSALAEMALIDSQARGLGIDLDLVEAVTRNETPDQMRKRLFDKLAEKSKMSGPNRSSVDVLRDEGEGRAEAIEVSLIERLLGSGGAGTRIEYAPKRKEAKAWADQHRARAQEYHGLTLVEIAAQCIGHRGAVREAQKWDIFERAMFGSPFNQRAYNSTSDFPAIFLNALNKALLARYELHMPTYREIAIERPFNDFRPHPQIRAGEFPTLLPVQETGELQYGSSADSKESVSVLPYGRVFAISRTMLVNDDLGAIDQILGSAGDMVMIFENNTFFTMFNSNPTLNQDSTAVFAAGHGNLAASGAVPSVTSIGSARQALRAMKSISGNFLNVPPRIILTGPAQETAADQMVTAITPTLTTSVNPFSGRLRSVSDANITDTSWYLLAEPGRVPCFIYGFLNGSNGPRVRTFEPFGVQGVKISVEHDFGVGAIDYRGAYRNPGA